MAYKHIELWCRGSSAIRLLQESATYVHTYIHTQKLKIFINIKVSASSTFLNTTMKLMKCYFIWAINTIMYQDKISIYKKLPFIFFLFPLQDVLEPWMEEVTPWASTVTNAHQFDQLWVYTLSDTNCKKKLLWEQMKKPVLWLYTQIFTIPLRSWPFNKAAVSFLVGTKFSQIKHFWLNLQ